MPEIPASHRQRQKGRTDHWDRAADIYDARWSAGESGLYAVLEARKLADLVQPAPDKRILDVCCGSGRNTMALASSGARFVGVDAASKMVQVAEKKARAARLANVQFLQADVLALPFPENFFDAVIGTRFMYMMDDAEKQRLIAELRRVLKPQGTLVLQFNSCLWGLKHEILNFFAKRGFRLRQRYLWPGQARRLFQGFQVETVTGIKFPPVVLRVERVRRSDGCVAQLIREAAGIAIP